ncbi:hypothetical protein B9Z19DRAFT_1061373 [Tuber borchii]|uniref:Uncharacterized protein n=1 Tax=Tuber borchii TaxID=42251 RepID=A0A2T7A5B3_TUBBO|nr:hypothetical protein B9Z19DRAFT_1061373 [Tuber borchii]
MSKGEVYEGNEGFRSHFPNFLASLNILSEGLFAAISIAERQIAILHDLHTVFSTIYRAKATDPEKGYPLRQSPFIKHIALTPIPSEYHEQVWPNILSTIDEVVRERNSFIEKIKELLKSMEARRYIV